MVHWKGLKDNGVFVYSGTGSSTVLLNKTKIQLEDIMKSSIRDKAENMLRQIRGNFKMLAGKLSGNPDLEAEGKDEVSAGTDIESK
jgi:uncharacterized protein YjbJ (UPF0337 family)